jgi:hypothetical protein
MNKTWDQGKESILAASDARKNLADITRELSYCWGAKWIKNHNDLYAVIMNPIITRVIVEILWDWDDFITLRKKLKDLGIQLSEDDIKKLQNTVVHVNLILQSNL